MYGEFENLPANRAYVTENKDSLAHVFTDVIAIPSEANEHFSHFHGNAERGGFLAEIR